MACTRSGVALPIVSATAISAQPRSRRRATTLAAATAGDARHVGGGGDHRRLFHRHRDEVIATVNCEIGGDAERNLESADHILDHAVGEIERQDAAAQGIAIRLPKTSGVADRRQAIGRRQVAEFLDAGIQPRLDTAVLDSHHHDRLPANACR